MLIIHIQIYPLLKLFWHVVLPLSKCSWHVDTLGQFFICLFICPCKMFSTCHIAPFETCQFSWSTISKFVDVHWSRPLWYSDIHLSRRYQNCLFKTFLTCQLSWSTFSQPVDIQESRLSWFGDILLSRSSQHVETLRGDCQDQFRYSRSVRTSETLKIWSKHSAKTVDECCDQYFTLFKSFLMFQNQSLLSVSTFSRTTLGWHQVLTCWDQPLVSVPVSSLHRVKAILCIGHGLESQYS